MTLPNPPQNQPLRKIIQFNLMLDDHEDSLLRSLASSTARSRAQCLRQALRAAHNMLVAHIPTCANGNNCFVPQMHPKPPEPAA